MMHLSPLKAFGWNNKINPWTGLPIWMEMNPPRCVWCAQQWGTGIRGDYEGFLPYHGVFTRRQGLILYAVNWRAWKLTEQIGDRALHSWVSIYPETIDKDWLLKNNNGHRNTKSPQQHCVLFHKKVFFFLLQTQVKHFISLFRNVMKSSCWPLCEFFSFLFVPLAVSLSWNKTTISDVLNCLSGSLPLAWTDQFSWRSFDLAY